MSDAQLKSPPSVPISTSPFAFDHTNPCVSPLAVVPKPTIVPASLIAVGRSRRHPGNRCPRGHSPATRKRFPPCRPPSARCPSARPAGSCTPAACRGRACRCPRGLLSWSTRICASRFPRKSSNDQAAVLGHEACGAVVETRRVEIHHAAGLRPHERMITSLGGDRVADHHAAAVDALRDGVAAAEIADRDEAVRRRPDEAEHFGLRRAYRRRR